ncbi:hypothetical protein [Virgibacillus kimchii]
MDKESKDRVEKRIEMAGERARLEAKINDTYVVYIDENCNIVKEFPDGSTEVIQEKKFK